MKFVQQAIKWMNYKLKPVQLDRLRAFILNKKNLCNKIKLFVLCKEWNVKLIANIGAEQKVH